MYSPDRLRVIDACRHVTGTVISTSSERDGDLHFDVRLDARFNGMLLHDNYSEQHGALVVELMPRDHGHLPFVTVGDHVSLLGAYVDDMDHGWAELHPVWALSINGGRTYRSGPQYGGSAAGARSATAVASCRTSGGMRCVAFGGTTQTRSSIGNGSSSPSSSGSSSGSSSSSSSSSQVVHPGAFCSPVGAPGVTSRGTPMTCKTSAADSRARWRHSG